VAPVSRIDAGWWPRDRPLPYRDSDYRLWDAESRALFRFISRYEGTLTLYLGSLTITLDIDDLPMVFGELATMADALAADGGRSELYFAGHGTDLRLSLSREGDAVVVGVHPGLTAPPEFVVLDGQEVSVDADSFRREWLHLRERVSAVLAEPPSGGT
jgi:hypothetical protein